MAQIKDRIKDVKQTNSTRQVVAPPTPPPFKNPAEHGSVCNIHTLQHIGKPYTDSI